MNKGRETSSDQRDASRVPDLRTSSNGDDSPDSGAPLYVITLVASVAPLPMRAPTAPELAGLALFRSRQFEDGRERFRLHLGFFAAEVDAEQLLPLVRASYPAAIVAIAPEGSMGSLDDTAMARFSILRPVAKPAAASAAPATPATVTQITPPKPAAMPKPTTQPAAAPAAVRRLAVSPKPVAVAARTAAPAAAPVVASHSLLDVPHTPTFEGHAEPPPALRRADPVPPEPTDEVAPRDTQHYAVQLIWNRGPIELDKIPVLAIFTGYLLYAVESEPGPRRFFGVRLGFYADALSARLVAQYVRSEFKGVSVVPVSQREMTRASTAAIRLTASRRAMSSSITRSRWPSSPLAVDITNLRRAFTPGMS
jgi:hypothetical protein